MAKAPTQRQVRQAKGEDAPDNTILRLTWQGTTREIAVRAVTAMDTMRFERETGRSFVSVLTGEDHDIHTIGMLFWFAASREGSDITLEAVLEGVTYESVPEIEFLDGNEDPTEARTVSGQPSPLSPDTSSTSTASGPGSSR